MSNNELWRVEAIDADQEIAVVDYAIMAGDDVIAEFGHDIEIPRRIVACVNACSGIDVDVLEIIHSNGPYPESDLWMRERAVSAVRMFKETEKERDSLAEQNMALMNALEMLQGSWVEYGLPKTDRSFQISEAALATGGK